MGSHYDDIIMTAIASQITSLTIVYSSIYSGADQSKHQSSASLAFVRGIHRGPVNSPHKWPVTRKMFPFDDVIMLYDIVATHGILRNVKGGCEWGFCRWVLQFLSFYTRRIQVSYLAWRLIIWIQILLNSDFECPVKNNWLLVQMMAWCRRQAIIQADDGLVYWRIYASLRIKEYFESSFSTPRFDLSCCMSVSFGVTSSFKYIWNRWNSTQ